MHVQSHDGMLLEELCRTCQRHLLTSLSELNCHIVCYLQPDITRVLSWGKLYSYQARKLSQVLQQKEEKIQWMTTLLPPNLLVPLGQIFTLKLCMLCAHTN